MTNDLLYQVALTCVPQIGSVQAKILLQQFGTAEAVFKVRKKDLEKTEGIGPRRAAAIKSFQQFERCEAEVDFIEKYKITPLFINSIAYPKRLRNCYDAPILLYYRGTVNLNTDKVVSVVGTRNHTEYGKQICEQIIAGLAGEDILILSGLALGIDTIAHRTALRQQLPTVGVLAHGLQPCAEVVDAQTTHVIQQCCGVHECIGRLF